MSLCTALRTFAAVACAALVVGWPAGSSASAQEPAPTEASVEGILLAPRAFEGRVTVSGELIGDYGRRSDGLVWTQLNGDSYAANPVLEGGTLTGGNVGIGVRIPGQLVEDLDPPGGYRRRGPLVEVTGLWVYHDPDRGGESYLQVVSIDVIEPGRELGEGADPVPLVIGVVLMVLAAGLWSSRPRPD